ncbi:MAG: helix-turn-helix transcriptional regulator [Parasporobacterium sp.]|nr:helix-turn-helix transcriptional regulator [Parasporobacterium sp.]
MLRNLKDIRKAKNYTQKQLADKVNVSLQQIGHIERQESHASDELALAIARVLGTTVEELIGLPENTEYNFNCVPEKAAPLNEDTGYRSEKKLSPEKEEELVDVNIRCTRSQFETFRTLAEAILNS